MAVVRDGAVEPKSPGMAQVLALLPAASASLGLPPAAAPRPRQRPGLASLGALLPAELKDKRRKSVEKGIQ